MPGFRFSWRFPWRFPWLRRGSPKNQPLPEFTYFTQNALMNVLRRSDQKCDSCRKQRGFVYTGPFYYPGQKEVEICPFCIKDGSAAAKFDGSFNDIVIEFEGEIIDVEASKVPDKVVDELLYRTPGYPSWQGNQWIFFGGDGCVFHGDATKEAVAQASSVSKAHFDAINGPGVWEEFIDGYSGNGSVSVYQFRARTTDMDLFLWDMD